jgi:type II restriction enzyme
MIQLPYHLNRNLSNPEEAFNYFIETLKNSIFTWDYFVDFEKVIKNVSEIEAELKTLNRLIGLTNEEFDAIFINIVSDYPSIRKALPILIASRISKIAETPIVDDIKTIEAVNKKYLFDPKIPLTENIKKDLLTFMEQTGLKTFFVNREVNNLIDFCKGIEVGMDTNARKNRTGTSMENIVEEYIKVFCNKYNFKYIVQATKKKIWANWQINIEVDKIDRRFDFAILDNQKQLYLIEVNYYGSGGSKLKATAGEYKEVQKFLSDQAVKFIWITDGKGWLTAKTALNETFVMNDYTFNLQMLSDGILDEVVQSKSSIKI